MCLGAPPALDAIVLHMSRVERWTDDRCDKLARGPMFQHTCHVRSRPAHLRSDASRGINDSTMNAAAAELERNFDNRKHTHTHTHTHV